MNPDTQKIIALVEKQTGYRVNVDLVSGIHQHAEMISARPETPVHVIRVNADHSRYADYIVAAQCGGLLILWADPSQVPAMVFEKAKCEFQAKKWAGTKQLAAFPAAEAYERAHYYVEGLLRQVNSIAMEIRVANLCFQNCPSLRSLQNESFTSQLREISGAFSPKIKQSVPEEIFSKNMTMNAALALNWARISGSRLFLLPYEATGYLQGGQILLHILDRLAPSSFDPISIPTLQGHREIVDAWAENLSLRTLYRWEMSSRVHER